MPLHEFDAIKRNLHFANNDTLTPGDKLGKIRPLQDKLNKSLQQFGVFSKNLSGDEQMVPFFGRHSCKMYMKGKPVKFGYKLWVLCSSDGYPFMFWIYEGKASDPNPADTEMTLGSKIILKMVSILDDPRKYHIYMDNFFNSYDLLIKLRDMGMKATGTVRKDRLRGCPLLPAKDVDAKKNAFDRGFYDCYSDGNVVIVQWKDNKVVHIGSNVDATAPLRKCKRYSKKEL